MLNTRELLQVSVNKRHGGVGFQIHISNDFPGYRKSRLFINEKAFATRVESIWQRLKKNCSRLEKIQVAFSEEDYYDNMTDMYETPVFSIEKGSRKAKIDHHDHGSIPKEWSLNISLLFGDIKIKTQLLKALNEAIPNWQIHLGENNVKKFTKELNNLMGGKVHYAGFSMND